MPVVSMIVFKWSTTFHVASAGASLTMSVCYPINIPTPTQYYYYYYFANIVAIAAHIGCLIDVKFQSSIYYYYNYYYNNLYPNSFIHVCMAVAWACVSVYYLCIYVLISIVFNFHHSLLFYIGKETAFLSEEYIYHTTVLLA